MQHDPILASIDLVNFAYEIKGIVVATLDEPIFTQDQICRDNQVMILRENIMQKARELDADYIIGVRFMGNEKYLSMMYGTAIRKVSI